MKRVTTILILICVMLVLGGCENNPKLKEANEAYEAEHALVTSLKWDLARKEVNNVELKKILKDSMASTDKCMKTIKADMLAMFSAKETISALRTEIESLELALETYIAKQEDSNLQPQWGKGDLPADYVEYFGTGNTPRLNYYQNNLLEALIKENSKQHKMMGEMDISLHERIEHLEGEVAILSKMKLQELRGTVEDSVGSGLCFHTGAEDSNAVALCPHDGVAK